MRSFPRYPPLTRLIDMATDLYAVEEREGAAAFLALARASGIETVVAAPVVEAPLTASDAVRLGPMLTGFRAAGARSGVAVRSGSIVRPSPELAARLASGEPITVDRGRVVLVELPAGCSVGQAAATIGDLVRGRFLPVVLVPERHPEVRRAPLAARSLVDAGAVLAVGLRAFTGAAARAERAAAWRLLEAGTIHMLTTRAERAADLASLPAAMAALRPVIGLEGLARLLREFPQAVLDGARLPGTPLPGRRSRWERVRDRIGPARRPA